MGVLGVVYGLLRRLLWALLVLGFAASWLALSLHIDRGRPSASWLSELRIDLSPGEAIVIGRTDLGQRALPDAADEAHLRLARDRSGVWSLSSAANLRRVELTHGDEAHRARRWRLSAGDELAIGAAMYRIGALDDPRRTLTLELLSLRRPFPITVSHESGFAPEAIIADDANRKRMAWVDGALCSGKTGLRRSLERGLGTLLTALDGSGIGAKIEGEGRVILSIGGRLSCRSRLPAPGVEPGAVRLRHKAGAIYAEFSAEAAGKVRVRRAGGGGFEDPFILPWPISGGFAPALGEPVAPLAEVVLGRTVYRVELGEDQNNLTLFAERQRHVFLNAEAGARETPKTLLANSLRCMTGAKPPEGEGPPSCKAGEGTAKPGVTPTLSGVLKTEEPSATARVENAAFIAAAIAGGVAIGLAVLDMAFRRRILPPARRRDGERRQSPALIASATLGLGVGLLAFAALTFGAFGEIPREWLSLLLVGAWVLATTAIIRLSEARGALAFCFWAAFSVIAAIGSLSLQSLSAGAGLSSMQRFDHDHQWGLVVVFALVALVSAIRTDHLRDALWKLMLRDYRGRDARDLERITVYAARWTILVIGFMGPFLLGAYGQEEGLWGVIQPVELGKFMFYALLAAMVTRYLSLSRDPSSGETSALWRFFIGLSLACGYIAFAFIAAPVLVSDFSPALIMTIQGGVFLILGGAVVAVMRARRATKARRAGLRAPAPRPRRRLLMSARQFWRKVLAWLSWLFQRLDRIVALSAAGALAAIYTAFSFYISAIETERQTIAALEFSSIDRRIAANQDPVLHADWSFQLRRGWSALEERAEPDWPTVFKAAILGLPDDAPVSSEITGFNGTAVMTVPAIQDDLILIFLINRFGVGAAAALALAKIALVSAMLLGAWRVLRLRPGDAVDEGVRLLLALLSFGGGVLLGLHWLISWFNALGVTPIMGQPMTWISYARSHILMMALPIVIVGLAVFRFDVHAAPETRGGPPRRRGRRF